MVFRIMTVQYRHQPWGMAMARMDGVAAQTRITGNGWSASGKAATNGPFLFSSPRQAVYRWLLAVPFCKAVPPFSRNRWIFPDSVFGSAGVKTMERGYL